MPKPTHRPHPTKGNALNRVVSGLIKLVLRMALLSLGLYYLPQVVYGLQLDSIETLLALSLLFCGIDALLRPLLKLLAFPADVLTLGSVSRFLYALLMLGVLISVPFWFPGVVALATTFPQQAQAVLAYWVFILTVLALTR
jgi:uncharacterized membrane protein YvlD (DUF360 family)